MGPVDWYLDASILVALLIPEPVSGRADEFIASNGEPWIVSDLASAEFASALARRVRTRETTPEEARGDLSDFDVWVARSARQVEISPADMRRRPHFCAAWTCRCARPMRSLSQPHSALARRS